MSNFRAFITISLSAITAAVIAGGGVIVGISGSGYMLNDKSWSIACIVAAMAASKDIRSSLRLSPYKPNGDTTTFTKKTP